MKSTKVPGSAIAFAACIGIAAIAACSPRSGSLSEPAREASSENPALALHGSDERAIEIDDVRNYHLSVHG